MEIPRRGVADHIQEEVKPTLSVLVRAFMQQGNLNQAGASDRFGVSQSMVSNMLHDEVREYKVSTLIKLAGVMDLDPRIVMNAMQTSLGLKPELNSLDSELERIRSTFVLKPQSERAQTLDQLRGIQ